MPRGILFQCYENDNKSVKLRLSFQRPINGMGEKGFYIFGRIPNLSGLYPLGYLKKTSHNEGFGSGPVQRCDLIREPPRSGPSVERGFDLQADDKTFAVNE